MRLNKWLSPALVCFVSLLLFEWSCRAPCQLTGDVTCAILGRSLLPGVLLTTKPTRDFFCPHSGGLWHPRSNQPWPSQPLIWWMCSSSSGGRWKGHSWGGDSHAEAAGGDRGSSPFPAPVLPHCWLSTKATSSQRVLLVLTMCGARAGQGSRPCHNSSARGSILWSHTCRRQQLSHPCSLGQKLDAQQVVSCLCYCQATISHYFFSVCAQLPVRYKDEQPLWGFLYIFWAFSSHCGIFKLKPQGFWAPMGYRGARGSSVAQSWCWKSSSASCASNPPAHVFILEKGSNKEI